jgi:hypothetical protein
MDWKAKDFPDEMLVGDDEIAKLTEEVADGTQQDSANRNR